MGRFLNCWFVDINPQKRTIEIPSTMVYMLLTVERPQCILRIVYFRISSLICFNLRLEIRIEIHSFLSFSEPKLTVPLTEAVQETAGPNQGQDTMADFASNLGNDDDNVVAY